MRVKLLDLGIQYRRIKKEVLREVRKVLDSQGFVLGSNVLGLETEIAEYTGSRYAVGVASGSDAILLSLMALGVGRGDGVITTPYTFFATAGSIARLGAYPIFVDIHPQTYNINPDSLEILLRRRSRSIKVIIPVHLYGQCAEMGAINSLARKYGLKVIEDAAQSIGAEYRGRRAGSLGDAGCFSFYPTKNLGGIGDGGMITTSSKRLDGLLRILRVHGSHRRYYHRVVGVNSRLDEIQAAVLRVKLKYLDSWTEMRIRNAQRYNRFFREKGLTDYVTLPHVEGYNRSVFNQYVVRVKKRDALRAHLSRMGIGTEIYYPLPLHLQRCFRYLGYKRGDFPVAERAARETLALPIYPELSESKQRYVVSAIAEFYRRFG